MTQQVEERVPGLWAVNMSKCEPDTEQKQSTVVGGRNPRRCRQWQATVRLLVSSISAGNTPIYLVTKKLPTGIEENLAGCQKTSCCMRRLRTSTNFHSACAMLAFAVICIFLFSGAELRALATASNALVAGANPAVQWNPSLPNFVAIRQKISPLLQKQFKRQSLDQALLTSPKAYDSQANRTWLPLATDKQLPYGFDPISSVSGRSPPVLV